MNDEGSRSKAISRLRIEKLSGPCGTSMNASGKIWSCLDVDPTLGREREREKEKEERERERCLMLSQNIPLEFSSML